MHIELDSCAKGLEDEFVGVDRTIGLDDDVL